MPAYTISNLNPQTKFCEISAIFDTDTQSILELSIPRWRPARYSLQNYAELIQCVQFFDENDQILPYTKLNMETWIIQTHANKTIKAKYRFYANQFEAGGSFIDQDFALLNPINCLMYDKNGLDRGCSLEVLSENDWVVSGIADMIFTFPDYHHLVDTPLLLINKDSPKFKKLNFEVKDLDDGKIDIEIVIYGENMLDLVQIESDFKAFISEQVKVFKTFAVKNYTFLCILPDFPAYHGVEHQNSSVNIFGPGYAIHRTEDYKQFLGICCHEFFHHWNIKSMRPKELNQYDYSKEQLFTTGYVAEGFTTYYGDLILYRAGLITLEDFAKILSKTATSHIQNFGRFNSSMHESSVDLWLDGYKAGIPDDKVNIYTEGCLSALILDSRIRSVSKAYEHTNLSFRPEGEILANSKEKISHFVRNDTASLDHLLFKMFEQFGQQHIGYTEHDLIQLCHEITGIDFTIFFREFYGNKIDLIDALSQELNFLGLKLEVKDSAKSYESNFGFKISPNGEKLEITKVYPSSTSYQKIVLFDQLIAINGKTLNFKNYEGWFNYYEDQNINLKISRKGEMLDLELISDRPNGLRVVEISNT